LAHEQTKPDGHGLEGSALDKKEYRLTVEVDEADPCLVKWTKWAPGRVAERTIASLNLVAEGHTSWWVYFGVIPPLAIKKCVRTVTWLEVENWPEVSPIELDCPGVPAWHRKAWHNRLLKAVDKKLRQNGFSGRLSDTSARIP
jgi:hypothetical protein